MSEVIECNAWVLHKQWSGDTSARVTFFTRDQGLINGLCKGGRTPKKQALLQPFIPLWIAIQERSGWCYIQKVELLSPALVLAGIQLFSSLYVNELLFHALRPFDANPALYDAYEITLNALTHASQSIEIERILRRFEWQLLNAMGYAISLSYDSQLETPIEANSQYKFIASEGFTLAERGIPGDHLLALAQDKLDDPAVLKTAKWIMRRAVGHALGGKQLNSRQLFS